MIIQFIKNIFREFGFNITRYTAPMSLEDSKKELIIEEAKKFSWLKEYGFETIIDVGANEGQFAERILRVFPNASIYCFEPLTEVYAKLKENLKQYKKVYTYNVALGEVDKEDQIFNNEYSPSSSILELLDLHKTNFDYATKVESVKVTIRKLDNYFPNGTKGKTLLKIDVQGYEMHVLRGSEAVIAEADVIIVEVSFYPLYRNQPLFHHVYEFLFARNFIFMGNIDQLTAPTDNKVLQGDAIFIQRGNLLA